MFGTTKTCRGCGAVFARAQNDKRWFRCEGCLKEHRNAYMRKLRSESPKRIAYEIAYRGREEERSRKLLWKKSAAGRLAHKKYKRGPSGRAAAKRYYWIHRDAERIRSRERFLRNKDKEYARQKRWRLANPEKAADIGRRHREKITDGYLRGILKRYGFDLKMVPRELLDAHRLRIMSVRLLKQTAKEMGNGN